MVKIAFLAFAQAHQFLHFIPAALELARRPGVEVDILSASKAGLAFIQRYDPDAILHYRHLRTPSFRPDGLFSPPSRRFVMWWHRGEFQRYDAMVTTETSSAYLRQIGYRGPLIQIKHGAGDREGGYKSSHQAFDLILVAGEKDRDRMLELGLASEQGVRVTGYAKFECTPPAADLFPGSHDPIVLYNAHFQKSVSSWHRHGRQIIDKLASIDNLNLVVAPHAKLRPALSSLLRPTPRMILDVGSERSIDMTYTNAASIYIGDASSQVYEFIRTPRPCIFLNLDHVDWEQNRYYNHWRLGQVVTNVDDLPAAVGRAASLQDSFNEIQQTAFYHSLDLSPTPASVRQADAIIEFVSGR